MEHVIAIIAPSTIAKRNKALAACAASLLTVSTAGGASDATASAARDWQAVRDIAEIQYAPLPPAKNPPGPELPEWIRALFRALEAIFAPIGKLLGMSWPVFQWVLIGIGALLILLVLWRLAEPLLARWRNRGEREEEEEAHWAPSRSEAAALLEEADRLAGEGRFGEATHLLLRRSVGQIRDARPDWLIPASTAREIAALPLLPPAGRLAFATIAQRVERCVFALRDLDAGDWAAARAAYVDFARIELRA